MTTTSVCITDKSDNVEEEGGQLHWTPFNNNSAAAFASGRTNNGTGMLPNFGSIVLSSGLSPLHIGGRAGNGSSSPQEQDAKPGPSPVAKFIPAKQQNTLFTNEFNKDFEYPPAVKADPKSPRAGDATTPALGGSSGAESVSSDAAEDTVALGAISSTHYVPRPYHDYATIHQTLAPSAAKTTNKKATRTFPELLHCLLERAEEDGFDHVIGWMPHGRAFKVHDKKRFMSEICPLYFKQTRYASFQRQLNIYCFARLRREDSPDLGGYYHELFLRGKPDLVLGIERRAHEDSSGCGGAQHWHSPPHLQPDFYGMPYVQNTPSNQEEVLGSSPTPTSSPPPNEPPKPTENLYISFDAGAANDVNQGIGIIAMQEKRKRSSIIRVDAGNNKRQRTTAEDGEKRGQNVDPEQAQEGSARSDIDRNAPHYRDTLLAVLQASVKGFKRQLLECEGLERDGCAPQLLEIVGLQELLEPLKLPTAAEILLAINFEILED